MIKVIEIINELLVIVDDSDKLNLQIMLQKYLARTEFTLIEDSNLNGLNLKNTRGMSVPINRIWYKAMDYANTILGRNNDDDEFFLNIYQHYEKDSIGMAIYNIASEMQMHRHYIYHNLDVLLKKEIMETFDFFVLTTFVNKILEFEGCSQHSI